MYDLVQHLHLPQGHGKYEQVQGLVPTTRQGSVCDRPRAGADVHHIATGTDIVGQRVAMFELGVAMGAVRSIDRTSWGAHSRTISRE